MTLSCAHALSKERVRKIFRVSDVTKIKQERKIGTWSVYKTGKAADIIEEMGLFNIDILGCRIVRLPNSGHCTIGDQHLLGIGVAIIVTDGIYHIMR